MSDESRADRSFRSHSLGGVELGPGRGTARSLLQLFEADRQRLQKLGRASNSALRVHAYLQWNPISSIARIAEAVNLSHPTIGAALKHLEKLRIVRELTGGNYDRRYTYDRYLNILAEDTEPLTN